MRKVKFADSNTQPARSSFVRAFGKAAIPALFAVSVALAGGSCGNEVVSATYKCQNGRMLKSTHIYSGRLSEEEREFIIDNMIEDLQMRCKGEPKR